MNNLQIFNREVIPVYTTEDGKKVVIGRELHKRLNIATKYQDWFSRMCDYGFNISDDYLDFWQLNDELIFENVNFASPQQASRAGYSKNHLIQLDMAKHISMIQRTPEGKAIRQKLIELETSVSSLSPELQFLIKLELGQKQQAVALVDTNKRLDNMGELITLDAQSWRTDCRTLIIRIAQLRGGNEHIRYVNQEVFQCVDQRAGVSLNTRLTNKRRRMAEEGVCKTNRDKLNKVDVIAEDKKLIQIYLSVVKDFAIRSGITSQEEAYE